jgi:thioredoxin-like negative regulator of GroEL
MKLLISQIEFEQLIGLQEVEVGVTIPEFTAIYFTASWCSACRRLDLAAIEAATPGVNWLKCDVDMNNYTPGYCGVRSIPAFLVVNKKKVSNVFQSSDTNKVIEWVTKEMKGDAPVKETS